MLATIRRHGHPQNPSLNQIWNLKVSHPRDEERKQARSDDFFNAKRFNVDAALLAISHWHHYLPRDIIRVDKRNVAGIIFLLKLLSLLCPKI